MNINILLLKQTALLSVFAGLITGLVTLIPLIGPVVFTFYFMALSAGIIVYLTKINILGTITVKEGGIIGAVVGFVSFLAFSCVFIPMSALISFIFNSWVGSIIISCFTSIATFFVLLFLLFFVALLCALMNGFSGAVTVYVYEVLAGLKHNEANFKDYTDFQRKL